MNQPKNDESPTHHAMSHACNVASSTSYPLTYTDLMEIISEALSQAILAFNGKGQPFENRSRMTKSKIKRQAHYIITAFYDHKIECIRKDGNRQKEAKGIKASGI